MHQKHAFARPPRRWSVTTPRKVRKWRKSRRSRRAMPSTSGRDRALRVLRHDASMHPPARERTEARLWIPGFRVVEFERTFMIEPRRDRAVSRRQAGEI